MRRGYLEREDEYKYEITGAGVKALGIVRPPRGKRATTIIKQVLRYLEPDAEVVPAKDLPPLAADEDHNTGHVAWYNFSDALCGLEAHHDDLLRIAAQIACDYANELGHNVYVGSARAWIIFYNEEQ